MLTSLLKLKFFKLSFSCFREHFRQNWDKINLQKFFCEKSSEFGLRLLRLKCRFVDFGLKLFEATSGVTNSPDVIKMRLNIFTL